MYFASDAVHDSQIWTCSGCTNVGMVKEEVCCRAVCSCVRVTNSNVYQVAVKISYTQIPKIYDCTIMIQATPLFETKNVAFSLKQQKDQTVKNVEFLNGQPIPS